MSDEITRHKDIRLPHFDYSQSGAYVFTVVVQNRDCCLGTIHEGEFRA
jgi:hypothetical protein